MPVCRPRSASIAGSRSAIGAESLEVRILPTVSATLAGGTLTLQGDQSANAIRLEQSGNSLVITGENGTLIRYRGDDVTTVTLAGVQNLKGYFGEAADVLKFQNGVTLNNVTLNLGGGANDVEFREADITGKTMVTGGNDADKVTFDSGDVNQVTLNLINGNDDVEFIGAVVNGLVSINTGNGIDTVKASEGLGGVGNTFSGAVTIKTGNQADVIDLRDSVFANLTIDVGADNDEIDLETITVNGRLSVSGGAGDDELNLADLVQAGTGTNSISGLAGQDDVTINGALFASAVSINMGAGPTNELRIDDVQFQKSVSIISTGPNDRLRIEQNLSSIAATKFAGAVNVQMGPGSVINLAVDDVASYIESAGLVTVKGSKPNLLVNLVPTRIEFALPPVLKNAEWVDITVVV
jgi:hypothetical protein